MALAVLFLTFSVFASAARLPVQPLNERTLNGRNALPLTVARRDPGRIWPRQQSSDHSAALTSRNINREISVPLTIDGQVYTVQVDTGSSLIWVVSDGFTCYSDQQYTQPATSKQCKFDATHHPSSQNVSPDDVFTESYGAGTSSVQGYWVHETVALGGVTIQDQQVGVINQVFETSPGSGQTSGLLGMGFPTWNGTTGANYQSLVSNLQKQNLPQLFSMSFAPDGGSGTLILGGEADGGSGPWIKSEMLPFDGHSAVSQYYIKPDGFVWSAPDGSSGSSGGSSGKDKRQMSQSNGVPRRQGSLRSSPMNNEPHIRARQPPQGQQQQQQQQQAQSQQMQQTQQQNQAQRKQQQIRKQQQEESQMKNPGQGVNQGQGGPQGQRAPYPMSPLSPPAGPPSPAVHRPQHPSKLGIGSSNDHPRLQNIRPQFTPLAVNGPSSGSSNPYAHSLPSKQNKTPMMNKVGTNSGSSGAGSNSDSSGSSTNSGSSGAGSDSDSSKSGSGSDSSGAGSKSDTSGAGSKSDSSNSGTNSGSSGAGSDSDSSRSGPSSDSSGAGSKSDSSGSGPSADSSSSGSGSDSSGSGSGSGSSTPGSGSDSSGGSVSGAGLSTPGSGSNSSGSGSDTGASNTGSGSGANSDSSKSGTGSDSPTTGSGTDSTASNNGSSDTPTNSPGYLLLVDSGVSAILLNADDARAVNNLFSGGATYDASTKSYNVDCGATPPKFGVKIGDAVLYMKPEHMIQGTKDHPTADGDRCSTAIGVSDTVEHGKFEGTLGLPFLLSVVSVFDMGAKEMRFKSA